MRVKCDMRVTLNMRVKCDTRVTLNIRVKFEMLVKPLDPPRAPRR